jgi:hypothetical protein
MAETPTADPKIPGPQSRQRAYRLRARVRRGDALEPEDVQWLHDYENTRNVGASSSQKLVHIEERTAAIGTGSAAVEAAAAATLAREEGRRIDYLTEAAVKAVTTAAEIIERAGAMYERMTSSLLERTEQLEEVHLAMLGSVRENYLARTQAEVDTLQAQARDGNVQEQLLGALLQRLGVPQGGKPKNGAK